MMISRRKTGLAAAALLFTFTLGLAGCNQQGATGGGAGGNSKFEAATDIPMGSKDAKLVMVEYASITCPHCANFHTNVLPVLKTKYIDTGKVRYVFREFPTPPIELAMAGHLMARCVGGDKRNEIIDTLMRQQREIMTQASGPTGARQALMTIAASAGMNEQQFDACMENEKILQTLVTISEDGQKAGVAGTPTVFFNGELYDPPKTRESTAEDLSAAIDAALAKIK